MTALERSPAEQWPENDPKKPMPLQNVYVSADPRYKRIVSAVDDLRKLVPGSRVSDNPSDRVVYSRDLWPRELIRLRAHDATRAGPAAIVWPSSQADLAAIVRYARDTMTPIVPFGAGSGVCGAIAPERHTIVIDLKALGGFTVRPEAGVVEVGAGMLGITLERELEALGYTVGHFPSSILCSTVGGWLAARGAGQCSGLYGKIEDMVVGCDAVLGCGEAVRMDWHERGPNLAPLLIGSEGTLGIISSARLRLHRTPKTRAYAGFAFGDVESGWQALREIYQTGLRPAVARLYDALDTALHSSSSGPSKDPSLVIRTALRIPRAINRAVRAFEGSLLKRCQLVLIFEGDGAEVTEDNQRALSICASHGGQALGEAPARAWQEHRYSVSYRQSPVFRSGAFSDTMEVAAPWSKLRGVYDDVRRALGRYVIVLAHVSHVYPDGCSIYFTFSAKADNDEKALALYDALWPAALSAALQAGATLSHHHGVGRSKAPLMGAELGYGVEIMRRLKYAWDPANVLNPGALLPRASPEHSTLPEPQRAASRDAAECELELDEQSLLADFDARMSLDQCENLLVRRGYTLDVDQAGPESLADWVFAGMPGARSRWEDPVDHTLVGLSALLGGDKAWTLTPVPRRAVGPDLSAFFIGERRVGRLARATLRVHPVGAERSRSLPSAIASSESLSPAETAAWDRAVLAQLA
jgi:alkyldihydroxyacetonephosphate synthase